MERKYSKVTSTGKPVPKTQYSAQSWSQKKPETRETESKSSYKMPTLKGIEGVVSSLKPDLLIEKEVDDEIGLLMVGLEEIDDPSLSWIDSSVWAVINGKTICVAPGTNRPIEHITAQIKLSEDGKTVNMGKPEKGEYDDEVTAEHPIGFVIGSEGFGARVMRFRGENFFLTRNKIRGERTKWGDVLIIDAYKESGGYGFEHLFEGTHSSPFVYSFTITCQKSVTGTRQVLRNPKSSYITYNGVSVAWGQDFLSRESGKDINKEYGGWVTVQRFVNSYYSTEKAPETVTPSLNLKVYTYDNFPGEITESLGVIGQVSVSPEEAETFLNWGFYQQQNNLDQKHDIRVQPGESLIFSANGRLHRVVHPSFNWRNSLRRVNETNGQYKASGGEPKIVSPFWRSIVGNYKSQEEYDNWFLPIETMPTRVISEYVKKEDPCVFVEYADTSNIYEKTKTDTAARRKVSFTNFFLSLPPHSQPEALELWLGANVQLQRLTKFIIGLQKNLFYFVNTKIDSTEVVRLSTKDEERDTASTEGFKVIRGVNRWYYKVLKLDIPDGMYYVLLPEEHPKASRIAIRAMKYAMSKSEEARGEKKRGLANWNKIAVNRMLDYENPNHVKQMVDQLAAVDPSFFENMED